MAEITAHQQRNELAARVHVTHITVKVGTIGAVVYNSVRKYWGLGSDPQVRIKPEDLVFSSNET